VTREQLEHLLRAASTIAGERGVLFIGSQSSRQARKALLFAGGG
jgi:hypothetical protein